MKIILQGLVLLWIGTFFWWLGSGLSADAVAIVIGLLFGLLAGIPSAAILFRSGQRKEVQAGRNNTNVYLVHVTREALPAQHSAIVDAKTRAST